jgi:hypothetical protein
MNLVKQFLFGVASIFFALLATIEVSLSQRLEMSPEAAVYFVIPPRFATAQEFIDGLAIIFIGGKWGWINKSGEYVLKPQYDAVLAFKDNLAAVRVGGEKGRWGYISKSGKVVIKPQFRAALSFNKGYATVYYENWNREFIDRTGKIVTPPSEWFGTNDLFPSLDIASGKWGYMSRDRSLGSFTIAPTFDVASEFCENSLAIVEKDKLKGVILKDGSYKVPPQFDDILTPCWSRYTWRQYNVVRIGDRDTGKYGIVDLDGKYILPPFYEELNLWYDEWIAFRQGEKWGYIDTNGRVLVAPIFERALPFAEGLAAVKYNGLYGYIARKK